MARTFHLPLSFRGVAWLATLSLTPLAASAGPVGIYLEADAISSPTITAYYASAAGVYPGVPAGLTVIGLGPASGSTSVNPTAMPVGLTTGTLQVNSTGAGGRLATSATASASLEEGALRGIASSDVLGGRGSTSLVNAQLRDNVRFSVLGGGSAVIRVNAHLDGTFANVLSGNPLGSEVGSQNFVFQLGASSFHYLGGCGTTSCYFGHNGPSDSRPPFNWVSFAFSNESATGFDFTGQFSVTDGDVDALSMALLLRCDGGAVCDFSHTGRLAFVLPSNVSFTSDSGVLLTGIGGVPGVPEPQSLTLLLAGLGLAGLCKRRTTPPCPSPAG